MKVQKMTSSDANNNSVKNSMNKNSMLAGLFSYIRYTGSKAQNGGLHELHTSLICHIWSIIN